MRHVLAFLCTAFLPFLTMDEAAASLLLNNNPTPPSIELDPAFVSGKGYQLAKVTWLPDYLGNNKSHGGGRVDDGGKDVSSSTCEEHGYLSSCPAHKIGSGVKHPVQGLTCYEKCVCDASYYKYNRSSCASPKVLGGESCSLVYVIENDSGLNTLTKTASAPTTSANTGTPSLRSTASVSTSLDTRIQASLEDERNGFNLDSNTYYSSCTCPAEYNLSVCPTGANCVQCDSKYKFVDCQEGFTANGNTCVKTENCSAYPLTVCPTGGICSKCPDNNAKLKLDSCDTSKGWKLSGNTCAAVTCPAGYTAGVTSCTSGSTKPDYSSNGWSGGQQCGVCKCNNIDSNCTAANYPLTTQSDSNANYSSCSTGCGSEKVTRYKITSCKSGYELKNNACEPQNDNGCPNNSAPLGECPITYGLQVNAITAGKAGCYPCVKCSTVNSEYTDRSNGNPAYECEKKTFNENPGRQGTCYKCTARTTCPGLSASSEAGCPIEKFLGTFLVATLENGTKCYNCIDYDCSKLNEGGGYWISNRASCPSGYSANGFTANPQEGVTCKQCISSSSSGSSSGTCPTTCASGYIRCPDMTPGSGTTVQSSNDTCCWKHMNNTRICPGCTTEELCKLYSNGCSYAGYTKKSATVTTSATYSGYCYEYAYSSEQCPGCATVKYYWQYSK